MFRSSLTHISFFAAPPNPPLTNKQASTVGAAFLTKTIPELNIKFEIW